HDRMAAYEIPDPHVRNYQNRTQIVRGCSPRSASTGWTRTRFCMHNRRGPIAAVERLSPSPPGGQCKRRRAGFVTSRMPYSYDITVFGGGIAGLWLTNILLREGYDVILIEGDRLGCGQTLASQGMIHGGQKYVLEGVMTAPASAILAMPGRWQASLEGR